MRLLAMTALLLTVLAHAEDTYDIKVYPAPKASGPLTLDGALDEPAWKDAPLVSEFTVYNAPTMMEVQTFLRVLYDDTYLYLGVVCDEPLMKKVVPISQARDAHSVFDGETVEMFVDPKHNHADYYQFAANVAGSVYDSRVTEPTWNADVVAKTKLYDDRWSLEFAIPWKDLGVEPKPMLVIGLNVCRDRYVGENREWSNWARTNANFHDPERFGHVVLSPTPEGLGQLGDEFRKGDRRGTILIYSNEGFSQHTYRGLAESELQKIEALLVDMARVRDEEQDAKAKQELDARIARFRQEVAAIRERVSADDIVDARAWTDVSLRTGTLTRELGGAVWEARLAALLSGL